MWRCATSKTSISLFGHDEVADADVRIGRFRECPEIENVRRRREPLQRGHGARFVVEFAVIVVLDDAGARGVGITKKFEAAADRHQPPGRVLVRRGDEDQARGVLACADRHALRIERNGGDDGAGGPQRDVGAAIAGAFDPGVIAPLEQRIGDQRQAGLGGRHDQDLGRLGLDPAMNRQMLQQRLLQRRMVDGSIPPRQRVARRAPQMAAPEVVRKFPLIRQPRLERPRTPGMDGRPVRVVQAARPGRQLQTAGRGAVAWQWRFAAVERQAFGHRRTTAGRKAQIAFRGQLLDRKRNGVPRHVERLRELPARRQAPAGREASVRDQPSQLVGELAHQRVAAVARQMEHSGQQLVHNWLCHFAKTGSFIRASWEARQSSIGS